MTRILKKLNCKPGNYQCGGRCIRGNWKCKKNIEPEKSKQLDTSVTLINAINVPQGNDLFLSPQEAKKLKAKKIKDIANRFIEEANKIKKDLEELDERLADILDDDSISDEEYIIEENRINKEREKLNNKAMNLAKELIFNEIKKKRGIGNSNDVESKLNNFIEKNKENLKKFPEDVREQIIEGIKIALENFGNAINIEKYDIIPYNKEIEGDEYDTNLGGYNNGKQIAIKPGNNVKEIVIHEFAHDLEDNFLIKRNLVDKLKEIGIKKGKSEENFDLELDLSEDEVIRHYAKRLYGEILDSGKIRIDGAEIITTILELLAADGIDINTLLNKDGELKQQIYIILEALL